LRPILALFLCSIWSVWAAGQEIPGPFASFDRASAEVLNDPHDLAIGPDGRLYVADKFGSRIAVMDAETLELVEIRDEGKLPGVHDISFGPDGRAAIAVTGLDVVLVFERYGNVASEPVLALPASRTEGALAHSNGRIYAMAGGSGMLIAYENGKIVALAAGHFGAHDVAEAPDGSIWVADNFNKRLVKYSPELKLEQLIDDPKFGFVGPRYLDVDDFGRLIVADQDAHRVLMIDPNGEEGGSLVGVIGTGSPGKGPNLLDDPEGVAVHGNRYYFSDSDNNRIVRYKVVTN
jgi:DNA-binding beta-propeller fold protein YncE